MNKHTALDDREKFYLQLEAASRASRMFGLKARAQPGPATAVGGTQSLKEPTRPISKWTGVNKKRPDWNPRR